MRLVSRLDDIHLEVKSNKWFGFFAIFIRIALAAGFIPSGLTKIFDERFTSLSIKHPMGNYLEALYHTGYYYHFIGYLQVAAALLLLIPSTATLGAVLYFPIILNICILSLAVGFDGSLVTSPLMVLANLYLLCWYYDRLKFILPFHKPPTNVHSNQILQTNKFPLKFFLGTTVTIILTVFIIINSYTKKTRNTLQECQNDCIQSDNSKHCFDFCECIHTHGKSFNECGAELRNSKQKK
ncbi:MAG: DoxX family protein [Saprospiraceae bacterium]|nr:DoxX family protein [Saprospiraceae bacterium]